jgi:organic hydroperoxide reductase OsmC/OhrA
MSEYQAKIIWNRNEDETFIDNKYSRGHQWEFDGGTVVPASSSPHIVPLPYSVAANVDPEEAFIATLSSCHMLFFLGIAAKQRFVVDAYIDDPLGIMEKGDDGKVWITKVTLRPKIEFSGDRQPTLEQIKKIHHQSHQLCFIANSVKAEVVIED